MQMNWIQISTNILFRGEHKQTITAVTLPPTLFSTPRHRGKKRGRKRGNNTVKEEIKLSLYTNNNLPSKPRVLRKWHKNINH